MPIYFGPFFHPQEASDMVTPLQLQPLVALIAGLLILIIPRLLNYIVAVYLIVIGLLGLLHSIRL